MKYSSDRTTSFSEVSSEDESPEKSDRYIGFRPDKWGGLGAIWEASTPNTMVAGGLVPGKHADRDVAPPLGIPYGSTKRCCGHQDIAFLS